MTLFPEEDQANIDRELKLYERHIRNDHDFILDIEPVPTPRPRGRAMKSKYSDKHFVHFYNEPHYTKYKDNIVLLLKDASLGIKKGDYKKIFVTMYMPYPASTPASKRIDGAPHRKKPDWDNYIKGFQDALEQAGIVDNDGAISQGSVRKAYTTKHRGFIGFTLV
jgi:Holliday junction resolvase RusA-like endonuclease